MSLPKYISYWYIQDAIKKATRDCMYYGQNHPQCKASWKDVECVEAYFVDRFNKIPTLTRFDIEECKLKKINVSNNRNADFRENSYGKDNNP